MVDMHQRSSLDAMTVLKARLLLWLWKSAEPSWLSLTALVARWKRYRSSAVLYLSHQLGRDTYGNGRYMNYGTSKSSMIVLANVAALEGEEFEVNTDLNVPARSRTWPRAGTAAQENRETAK